MSTKNVAVLFAFSVCVGLPIAQAAASPKPVCLIAPDIGGVTDRTFIVGVTQKQLQTPGTYSFAGLEYSPSGLLPACNGTQTFPTIGTAYVHPTGQVSIGISAYSVDAACNPPTFLIDLPPSSTSGTMTYVNNGNHGSSTIAEATAPCPQPN